jgi:hypothetical protein
MIVRPITHDDLGCASSLVGDEQTGVAAVVDPRLDTAPSLVPARDVGVDPRRTAGKPTRS